MNLKQFASTKKGQLTLCLSFLGIVWLILLISYGSSFLKDIPDQKKIDTAHPTGARVRICTAAGDFIALGEVREFENGTAIKGIKYFDV